MRFFNTSERKRERVSFDQALRDVHMRAKQGEPDTVCVTKVLTAANVEFEEIAHAPELSTQKVCLKCLIEAGTSFPDVHCLRTKADTLHAAVTWAPWQVSARERHHKHHRHFNSIEFVNLGVNLNKFCVCWSHGYGWRFLQLGLIC